MLQHQNFSDSRHVLRPCAVLLHKETQGLLSQNGAARRTERKTATQVWLDLFKAFVQRWARDTEVGGLTSQLVQPRGK